MSANDPGGLLLLSSDGALAAEEAAAMLVELEGIVLSKKTKHTRATALRRAEGMLPQSLRKLALRGCPTHAPAATRYSLSQDLEEAAPATVQRPRFL